MISGEKPTIFMVSACCFRLGKAYLRVGASLE